jgi:hypothetical protein
LAESTQIADWYDTLAASLAGVGAVPKPLEHDKAADGRLVEALRRDLTGEDGRASSTAVRMIWTGDHLDAVRRLQATLSGPARTATREHAFDPLTRALPWRSARANGSPATDAVRDAADAVGDAADGADGAGADR